MAKGYRVERVRDDTEALRGRLQEISRAHGKVISITWQPESLVVDFKAVACFTIVSEYGS